MPNAFDQFDAVASVENAFDQFDNIEKPVNAFDQFDAPSTGGGNGKNESLNFVDRYQRPSRYPTLENSDGSYSTHRMASAEVDGKYIAYPTIVQMQNGELKQLNDDEAFQYAMQNNEYLTFPDDNAARAYAEDGYKKDWGKGENLPSMEATEYGLLDRAGDWIKGLTGADRARASNELAMREYSQEKGLTVDEAYQAAGGSRPALDPLGRGGLESVQQGYEKASAYANTEAKRQKQVNPNEAGTLSRAGEGMAHGFDNMVGSLEIGKHFLAGGDTSSMAQLISDKIEKNMAQSQNRSADEAGIYGALDAVTESQGLWEGIGSGVRAAGEFFGNPDDAVVISAEQAPNMIPAMGLGAAGAGAGFAVGGVPGAIVGGRTGMAAGTVATEFGAEIEQAIVERLGNNIMAPNRKELIQEILNDPQFVADAQARAAKKGVTVALVDQAFLGLSGKIANVPGNAASTLTKAKYGAAGVGVDMAGESIGEASSQLVARGEVDAGDALLEGFASGPSAIAETAIGKTIDSAKNLASKPVEKLTAEENIPTLTAEQQVTLPQEEVAVAQQPAAQPVSEPAITEASESPASNPDAEISINSNQPETEIKNVNQGNQIEAKPTPEVSVPEAQEAAPAKEEIAEPSQNIASDDQKLAATDENVAAPEAPEAQIETEKPEKPAKDVIDSAANEAATSTKNDLPEPTQAQKEAGNYKLGKVKVQGLDISIENPKDSVRSGTAPDGKPWSNKMGAHYGYIRKTEGADGDHVDVFLGDFPESDQVWIVDQVNQDGSFDEHKVLMGFKNKITARKAYVSSYDKGWKVGPITQMTTDEFKSWLDGDTKKPLKLEQPTKAPSNEGVSVSEPQEVGEISKDLSGKIKRQAGKIKLEDGNSKYGKIHISERHGKEIEALGYTVESFVKEVSKKFNAIYKANAGELLLAKRNGKDYLMFIRLKPSENGDFYSVTTAYKSDKRTIDNRLKKEKVELLWEDIAPSSDSTSENPAFAHRPEEKAGSGEPNVTRHSNNSVAPDAKTEKQKTDGGKSKEASEDAQTLREGTEPPSKSTSKTPTSNPRPDNKAGTDEDSVTRRSEDSIAPEEKSEKPGDKSDDELNIKDAKFSITENEVKNPISDVELQKVVDQFMSDYNGNIPIDPVILDHQEEAYGKAGSVEKIGRVEAAYHAKFKKLLLIRTSIRNKKHAQRILAHEILGHYGLNTFSPENKRFLLERILASRKSLSLKSTWKKIDKLYPKQSEMEKAEEVFAFVVEEGDSIFKRFIDWIADALRKILKKDGLVKGLISKSELRDIARQIAKGIKSGERDQQNFPASDFAQFSKSRNKHVSEAFDDLDQVQIDAFRKIAAKSIPQRITDRIDAIRENIGLKVRQGVVDSFAALRKLDEQARGEDVVEQDTANSSWVLARMSKAASGALNALISYGRIYMDGGVIDVDTGKPGLVDVLRKLGGSAEVERFMGWLAGNRSEKLMSQGKENLFTPEEVAALKRANSGIMKDGRNRSKVYSEVFKEFRSIQNDVLKIAEQAGIITPDAREMWADEFYVPFYRVLEDKDGIGGPSSTIGGGITRQQAYKKLKGGRSNLNDLLQNTLMNFEHLLSASLKNQAANKAIENAVRIGIAEQVSESSRDKKQSTFVLKEGVKTWYDISDPLVFRSLSAMAGTGMNGHAMKVMRSFKRVFTNFVTASPQFMIANLLRDSFQSVALADMKANPIASVIRGVNQYGVFDKKKAARAHLQATGGAFSFGHVYGDDADSIKIEINRSLRGAKIIKDGKDVITLLRKGWDAYHGVSDSLENANRAALYDKAIKDGKTKLQAAFQARDLMDFSAHGDWAATRFLISVVPFLNARLQGLDKIHRSGVKPGASVIRSLFPGQDPASDTDKKAAARFAAVTGALTLATLALYLKNWDDPDYERLEDWQKDSYWFVKVGTNAFFVPKPFEVGAIATMAERTLEQLIDDKATGKLFAERLGHMLSDTFSFDPTPQLFAPMIDLYANKDSFTGRPIEGIYQQNLSPSLRTRTDTTKLAKFGSWVTENTAGAVFGKDSALVLSPIQVDHLIGAYLGWVGELSAATLDVTLKAINGEEDPSKKWYEYQPMRRFYKDLNLPGYSKYQSQFYDNLKEITRINADIQRLRELGKIKEAQQLAIENKDKLRYRTQMNRIQKQLSTLNNRAEMVRKSNLSAEEKRRRLDLILLRKSKLTEMAAKKLN